MKRLLIVMVTVLCLAAAAATAVHAMRVPGKRAGDPDEVQSAKRHDEPAAVTRPADSQGLLTQRRACLIERVRGMRRHIKVRFPGREFFLEK